MASRSSRARRRVSFDELIENHTDKVQTIARILRAIVYQAMPRAVESVHAGARSASYKEASHEVCGIQPSKTHVKFQLMRGIELDDPDRLLSGNGKAIRSVQVKDQDAIPVVALKAFIHEGRKLAARD